MNSVFERMEAHACTLYIEANGQIQHRTLTAPRMVLEGEFMSLVNQAIHSEFPVMIKMSRQVPIYNDFDDQWIEREHYMLFKNNAYIQMNGE